MSTLGSSHFPFLSYHIPVFCGCLLSHICRCSFWPVYTINTFLRSVYNSKPLTYVISMCLCTGLTEPTDQCDAGYVCVSHANSSTPEDGQTGYECLPGFYCPRGSAQGIKCPRGTFSNRFGLENVTECRACTPGMYCQTEGKLG